MVIYADVLFFINLIFNYMTLTILGKFMKLYIKQLRLIAGSALGAAGTVIIFCLDAANILFKCITAVVMVLCAYGYRGKKTISVFAAFAFIMAAVSGVSALIISIFPMRTDSVIRNGILYFDISGGLLFAVMLAAYPTVCLLSKAIRERKNRTVYKTKIEKSGRCVEVDALFDSGNKLKEPITGRPVLVAEWEAVRNLFEDSVDFDQILDKAEEYKLWVIPYKSLGNDSGRIFAFTADRIQVEKCVTERVFVGITNETFSNEYRALLNADLI